MTCFDIMSMGFWHYPIGHANPGGSLTINKLVFMYRVVTCMFSTVYTTNINTAGLYQPKLGWHLCSYNTTLTVEPILCKHATQTAARKGIHLLIIVNVIWHVPLIPWNELLMFLN